MTGDPTRTELVDPAERRAAVDAALGRRPFDVLVAGGTVVDVATGELREADVGIVGRLIASVHPRGARADAARIVDAAGGFVAPGLIDSHMHVESSMMTPRVYAQTVLPQGTTTVVWDPHEVGNVLGLEGVRWAIAASRDLPLRVLTLAPSCVPSAPGLELSGATFDGPEMREMLSWPEIAGVAEVMDMRGVLDGSARMRAIVGEGLASGKLVCGHARGLAGPELEAYAAAGVGSDHELVSAEDCLAKLRAGLTVELRGSHDYLLPDCVAALNALPMVPQTLTLCTDDVFPDDLVDKGGMVDLLRRLVRYGLAPTQAIRAATLNAAMRLKRDDLGLVGPGRRADIVVFDDLATLGVRHVLADGELAASAGRLLSTLRPDPVAAPTATMRLAPLAPDDFAPRVPGRADGPVRLNAIRGARFTAWSQVETRIEAGRVVLPDGVSVMAMAHRHGRGPATPALALLEDWGTFRGAFATTVSHDSHNLAVFGRDPADMAAAANALIACGGGMAVAKDGKVTALLPLPVCGLLSEDAPEAIAAGFRAVKAACDDIAEWKPPYRVFKAFVGASLACNAGPHLTDLGLTDGGTGEIRPAVVA
ncbi:amidohydrolase family protein [Alsobacter sp. SYSU M60028]|uniref:Adenine deaminase n=1 Tax=Alsobacter ponti TaxID=2962936 RepID=A0ABT1L6Q2_9HYPH|nr:adenine deaminase C-terminal domain-containing protein [Alsobacter ponti]MCP8937082.1 amidohydrolase family protein [Alsobacter ponti]